MDQEPAEKSVTSFAHPAERHLPASRMLLRDEPSQSGRSRARPAKLPSITDGRKERRSAARSQAIAEEPWWGNLYRS